MADALKHPAHLTVAALLEHDLNAPDIVVRLAQRFCRDRLSDPILQIDTGDEAPQCGIGGLPLHIRPVFLARLVSRVQQVVGGLAIVGEEKKP